MMKRFFITIMSALIALNLGISGAEAAGVNASISFQIEKSVNTAFVIDEKPAVDIKLTIPQMSEDTFDIKLITDYSIVELVHIDNKNAQKQEMHLEFAVEKDGYHHLCAQLLRNGAVYHEYEFEQYYIRSVSNDSYRDRGFNVHYEAGRNFYEDGQMLKAGGVPVLRVGLSWNSVEKKKGIYDFTKSDQLVADMGQYDLEAICIIDSYHFGHELYPDENGDPMMRTEEQINAFADFALATVKRYPQIKKWEIFNEPNFLMTGEEYFNVVYTVAKRIKAYDPENEIYAGGLAIYDTANFVNGFYIDKLYPYIDGISYHHYNHWRYADGPEFYATTDELADKMMKEGGWKKLIMTESGYSTGIYEMEVPEIKQASENVKRAVTCDWYGMDFLTLYNFKNTGYDKEDKEDNFGAVTYDYKPKQSYYALKQYLETTNRAVYVGEAYLAEDITAHIYAANDDYFIIAWAKNINDEADVRNHNSGSSVYSFKDENVRLEDMFGEHIGGNILNAAYQPVYIHGLSKDFCLRAVRENKDHDMFENVRSLMNRLGYSTEAIEKAYRNMCTSGSAANAEAYADSCYELADQIINAFLEGSLDISEAGFSNALSELYQICGRGMKVTALFDDICSVSGDIYEKYENEQAVPQDAVDKGVAYINEPYYKGRDILKKVSRYEEKSKVCPVKGRGFELKSDNVMIFSGSASAEEVLVKIDGGNGNTVYMNLLPTDGNGNYYFELTPDIPYGEYTVTVNNGELLIEAMDYSNAEDYLSVEDKITAASLLQAEKLLDMYKKCLGWLDIKYDYSNPQVNSFYWNETQWINITGKIERPGFTQYSDIILRAYDKTTNELKYIDSTYSNEDGAFRFSFRYDGDIESLDIEIDQGGVVIKDHIQLITENRLITGKVFITENTDSANIALQLENYFKADRTAQPVAAYYDSENKLICCVVIEPENVEYGNSLKNYNLKIPEDAAMMKVFVWSSLEHMLPYADSVSKDFAQ